MDRFNHRRYQKELPTNQQMQQSQEKANTTESPAFGQEVSPNGFWHALMINVILEDLEAF